MKINPTDEKKVVSIAQDLIYAESKGRADSQVTGSWISSSADNRIGELTILHGLGHTAAASTVSKHDTALAIASIQDHVDEIKIPRNINPGIYHDCLG